VLFYEGVLLMQFVTDADGDAAPRLIDAPISRAQAGALYRDLRGQIVGVLCCDLIHGDLSPYNVLLGAAGPTLIDFPQTISAAHNNQSEVFFRRDLDNILRFLAGLDPSLHAHRGDARAIWQAYVRRELTPDFVPAARRFEEERRPPPRAPGPAAARRPHREPARPQPAAPARPQHAAPVRDRTASAPRADRAAYQPPARPAMPQGAGPDGGRRHTPGPRARGSVEVYVKRTAAREPAAQVEVARPEVNTRVETMSATRASSGGRRGRPR
jgi:RIO kinase 1